MQLKRHPVVEGKVLWKAELDRSDSDHHQPHNQVGREACANKDGVSLAWFDAASRPNRPEPQSIRSSLPRQMILEVVIQSRSSHPL